jgi:hypothetical protein
LARSRSFNHDAVSALGVVGHSVGHLVWLAGITGPSRASMILKKLAKPIIEIDPLIF